MIIADINILKAILAGSAISLVFGVLGCFTLWRKMAYFGDSLSHSALLGIALGLLFNVNINIAIIFVCALFAIILTYLQHKKFLAVDSLLGVLAHASLSIGMVVMSLIKAEQNSDIHHYLFGDILNLMDKDVLIISIASLAVLFLLIKNWSSLNLITISEDLARAEGVNIFYSQLLLMLAMSIIVAVSINIVGILLITSMLVIPAASAKQFAKSPQAMAIISIILAIFAVILGIIFSTQLQISSGPAIVVTSVIIFILSALFKQAIQK